MHGTNTRGVTLIEVLLVIGFMAILGGIGVTNFVNLRRANEFDGAVKIFLSYLRSTQQRAISQDQSLKWGVRVNVPDPGQDFYSIFSCNSNCSATTITDMVYLNPDFQFTTPAQGSVSQDIIFATQTGLPENGATTIVIGRVSDPATTKTITISAQGLIELVAS